MKHFWALLRIFIPVSTFFIPSCVVIFYIFVTNFIHSILIRGLLEAKTILFIATRWQHLKENKYDALKTRSPLFSQRNVRMYVSLCFGVIQFYKL